MGVRGVLQESETREGRVGWRECWVGGGLKGRCCLLHDAFVG